MTVLYKNEDLYMKNVNICVFPAKRRSDGSWFFLWVLVSHMGKSAHKRVL